MYEKDELLERIIKELPKSAQVGYSLTTQLYYLSLIAKKLGLYDADDFLLNKGISKKSKGDIKWQKKSE